MKEIYYFYFCYFNGIKVASGVIVNTSERFPIVDCSTKHGIILNWNKINRSEAVGLVNKETVEELEQGLLEEK